MIRPWPVIRLLACVAGIGYPVIVAGQQAFPPLPDPILGANQQWRADATEIEDTACPSWALTDDDLGRLKSIGANTIRFPVYPQSLGVSTKWFSWKRGDVWDGRAADLATVDWRPLDAILDQLARHRLTPYICPHPYPAQWQTIYIPEDAERTLWFSRLIVRHVQAKYGGNVVYGWYENIWKNSHQPWATGVFRHTLSAGFEVRWRDTLRGLYRGSIGPLNQRWATNAASFDELQVPDLGRPGRVPPGAYANRRTYDLRLVIDLLSRQRLCAWREELRELAPGAMWVGACQHGFYGMHDTGRGHPPKCNWSVRTHALTSDALAADTYEREKQFGVFWRTVAKLASSEGKAFLVAELNAARPNAYEVVRQLGGPLRGVLVWQARGEKFGLLAPDGTPREERLTELKALFRALRESREVNRSYRPGRVHVYYPEETYEYAVLKRSHLGAYERVCEDLPPADLEPMLTFELESLPPTVSIFVLEKHLPRAAIDVLNRLGSRVVCWHRHFVDEDGKRIPRTHVPDDFYAHLCSMTDGVLLKDAFMRVEETERNIATLDDGAAVQTAAEFEALYGPKGIGNLIDGDPVASRVRFADIRQRETVDVVLAKPSRLYGAFAETAVEDPGRTPAQIRVLVLADGNWLEVANVSEVTSDRAHIRFDPVTTSLVRFDFGESTDRVGSRLMEVGLLEH